MWPGMARVLSLPEKSGEVEDLTATYALTDDYQLRPIQSEMLQAIKDCGGACCAVGVGWGKTLASFIAGAALGVERVVLMVPPALVNQTEKELARFREHFRIPANLTVLSYGKLSVADGTDLLERLAPQLIVADECHFLRHKTSARTKRVIRYFRAHPETHFVGLSGTLTAKSLKDYAHLVELALRNRSPVPLEYLELESWAACIDVGGQPTRADYGVMRPLIKRWDPGGGDPRAAFQARFKASPGVVATEEQAVSCSLYLRYDDTLAAPPSIISTLRELEKTWVTPGGDVLEDAISMARHRRHITCGFYYEWDWPGGVVDFEWLEARKEWRTQVQRVLRRPIEGRDSPLLVSRWAQADECRDLELIRGWEAWDRVRGRPSPPVKTIWIDQYLIDGLVDRALNHREPVIVWTQHRAVIEALGARGLPTYGPGTEPPQQAETCVMSIKAHGTGKNLQAWAHNILASFPSNGATLEQLLGRTHRPGQEADEVNATFFLPHPCVEDDVTKALEGAEYVESTQGNRQKLLYATWI